jgi:tetratricopeptide (TPR) repeat protein
MDPQQLFEMGLMAHRRGDLKEADWLYREILQAVPGHIGALHMLGVTCAQQGRREEAVSLLRRVVAQTPNDALALSNLGNALWESGQFIQALEVFDRSIILVPSNPDVFNNRGNCLAALARYPQALESYERAIALRPNFALAYKNKGDVLRQQGRHLEAIACYDLAIGRDPYLSDAFFGKGISLRSMARYQEALGCYDRALELAPGQPDILNSCAVCLQNLGRLDEAIDLFRHVISLAPEMVEARLNLSAALRLKEQFDEGFLLYEWRKKAREPAEDRRYTQPLWTGAEDIQDKTLFLYIEQGLGDAIMFYRFALVLREMCRHVILAVHPALLRLFRSNSAGITLIGLEDLPGDFDYHIPLASVPLALGIQSTSIPCPEKYLFPEADRVATWATRLGPGGFRVGVAWQGNMVIPGAEGKSFRLEQLERISLIPGVRLISLQKYGGSEQLGMLPRAMAVENFAIDEGPEAFIDTAAIMANCHLVIAADTGPAHLAGALGIPCWLGLKFVPDWRWFLSRDDTPWYSRMRLFRQQQPGDWSSVFEVMETELRQILERSSSLI